MKYIGVAWGVLWITLMSVCGSANATDTTQQTKLEQQGPWRFMVDIELNSPIIGTLAGGDDWFNTVAMAGRIGAHTKVGGLFIFCEYGFFEEPSYDEDVSNTILAFGGGLFVNYFDGRMRSMVQLGTTVLMTESFQNDVGTMGFFSELRPTAFVIPLKHMNLQIYPITLSWMIPVLQNIPLFYMHYRTGLAVGGSF